MATRRRKKTHTKRRKSNYARRRVRHPPRKNYAGLWTVYNFGGTGHVIRVPASGKLTEFPYHIYFAKAKRAKSGAKVGDVTGSSRRRKRRRK